MQILNKQKFKRIMKHYPKGGIVFAEYTPNVLTSEVMVTNGDFGATCVIPCEGRVFDFDWNIEEFSDKDLFVVFDHRDVLQMVQTLTKGLQIELKW
jgi:hypothetical protein